MRDLEFDIKARDTTAAAFDSARANARGFNHALDLTARGFGQAGVAAEDIDNILTQWAKRIGEAHSKGRQLAGIFRANNVALTDSEGRLRSSVGPMRDLLA